MVVNLQYSTEHGMAAWGGDEKLSLMRMESKGEADCRGTAAEEFGVGVYAGETDEDVVYTVTSVE